MKYNVVYRCAVIVWMILKYICQIYFFHIRHHVWDERTRQKWNALLRKQAKDYSEKAVRLEGVLIKVGQFLGTRADFMPDAFIQELRGLVDRVSPSSFSYAKSAMEKAWGEDVDKHLTELQDKPIAAASIGQVYRAKLKDGTTVAIKVQRYRVREIFHMDFKAMKLVFWMIKVFTNFGKKADLNALYRELIYVMDRELDFGQELAFGKYFKNRYKHNTSVYIPGYFEQLCTEEVLVMEWVDGAKITNLSYMHKHRINVMQTAKTLFEFYLDQFLHPGNFHADPHAGNVLIQQDGTIVIIDFGMIGEIHKQDIHYFKQLIQGLIIDDYDQVVETLDDMNFVLPNANRGKLKKMIKETIEMYRNGSFSHLDTHTMDTIKDDIRIFINDQPIQISADYAYLGRAVSIVFGLLISLYPDVDIEKWARPIIKEWLGGKGFTDSIYKQIAKDAAKPILSFPKAMLNWLENGEKNRQWEKEKQYAQLLHHFYILVEVINFILILGSVFAGFYLYGVTGYIMTGVFTITLVITLMKHYQMICSRK
ncbi:ABC transporter [Virgibacillus phasianinus]|uniref:ABC transporter n=2 Tax=Virgibacillus phasianinus TaxID=2017483 RepID=A0A220U859_9BACI|nr:ABC transporter [Virgibacillus phasianinus]